MNVDAFCAAFAAWQSFVRHVCDGNNHRDANQNSTLGGPVLIKLMFHW